MMSFSFSKTLVRTLATLTAIGIPIAVSVLVNGQDTIGINRIVESYSGDAQGFLSGLVSIRALFSFTAGLVSSLNPCGFVMLPAYLGLYLASNSSESEDKVTLFTLLLRAIVIGCIVTLGFVSLFAFVGTVIGLGVSIIVVWMPWVGLFIGAGLVICGMWLITGGKLYSGIAARIGGSIGRPEQLGLRGYFLFGISYAIASLSCTLPVFLSVIGMNFVETTMSDVIIQFCLYALGMGLAILVITISIALLRDVLIRYIRLVVPYVQSVGSGLMVVAGMYIIFYWVTIGGIEVL